MNYILALLAWSNINLKCILPIFVVFMIFSGSFHFRDVIVIAFSFFYKYLQMNGPFFTKKKPTILGSIKDHMLLYNVIVVFCTKKNMV